ncbi:MAG: DUF3810 domain-containing protein [Lachnospiraceae bacterium]|nr:DUF3810 domain-containing protein [Lachnospiraceae bacterium]
MKKRFAAAAILTGLSLLGMAAGNYFPDLLFPWYREMSRFLLDIISRATAFVPFALWEPLVLLIAAGIITSLILVIGQKRGLEGFLKWLGSTLLTASILFFAFNLLWGLNHYGPDLSEELGLEVGEYTLDELKEAVRYYMTEAESLAETVERDEEGELVHDDLREWMAEAGSSYEKLSGEYHIFSGSTVPVKKMSVFWLYMSHAGFTGIFIPHTAESTVNPNSAVIDLPFTMCHEAAHRCTIASEDEANFAAFLACSVSEDPDFRYSGYYQAFISVYNALYKADSTAASTLWTEDYELLRQDCSAAGNHYQKYEGQVHKAAEKVNDTYLKSYSEKSGVQSYGEAADYLIAWYFEKYR